MCEIRVCLTNCSKLFVVLNSNLGYSNAASAFLKFSGSLKYELNVGIDLRRLIA